MDLGLKDRVAIVTGSGRGIGRGIALKLAEEGASVVVNGLTMEHVQETVQLIRGEGGIAEAVVADVSKKSDVQEMVAQTLRAFGKIDILVNNAGNRIPALLPDITEEDWDRVIDVHLKGAFLCTQAVYGPMKANKYGRVIVIGSEGSLVGTIGLTSYIAAKAALLGFVMNVALEFARHSREGVNMTCNLVMPGLNMTDMAKAASPKVIDEIMRAIPLGRPADSREDIGSAVAFLASEKASYITGVKFSAGGGIRMCLCS